MYRDSTTGSLQNYVSFMLINDTSLMAWLKRVYVASYHCFRLGFFPLRFFIFKTSSICVLYRRYSYLIQEVWRNSYIFFTFLKNGAVTWPQDVVSPWKTVPRLPNVCCYLASSNLFSGCKKFKLMKLPRINSGSWTFLFTVTAHVRISFLQFGLLHVAKEKSRYAGVCEMCIWSVCVFQKG